MPRALGVIPARGGSKRVPRKNLRLLHGVPLIGYTIRACQAASKLTDWVVSTDDKEITAVALSYGARVIDQPMASDKSTSGQVCRYALDTMEINNPPYDIVVCLHPTSPIRDPKHIDDAIELLWESDRDVLASVCELPTKRHPNVGYIWAGYWRACDGKNHILNASIYAMKRDWLRKTNEHTDIVMVPFIMDRFHSLDIDEEIDFKLGELYLNALSS